jgi:microcystin degradation protein MlrC
MLKPRIGIFGLFGECNSFRTPIPSDQYRWMCYHEGASLLDALEDADAFVPPETRGFVEGMAESGPWEPVPLLFAISESGPPLDEAHFRTLMAKANALLKAAGPLDGVYITGHGSLTATQTKDTDRVLLALIRAEVGPSVPILETLDPHGKITPEMAELADVLLSYQTDPHIDMFERGLEAAKLMRRMLNGERFSAALVRLPILITTAAMVSETSPFRSAVNLGQSLIGSQIVSTSVVPGYPWTDTPYAGQCVIAYGPVSNCKPARDAALQIGQYIWDNRAGYRVDLLSLPDCVAEILALTEDPGLPPRCYAELADNPGGGGTSNTMYVVEALIAAGAQNVAIGPIFDDQVAASAHQFGVGATLDVTFNANFNDPFAKPLSVRAKVVGLADGVFRARAGPAKGVTVDQGKSAALQIDGILVVVTSRPLQALALEQFEMVDIDVAKLRAMVVKSRGHYQAAFSEVFDHKDMVPIDTPGWCTPHLQRLPYINSPDTCYPANPSVTWNQQVLFEKR